MKRMFFIAVLIVLASSYAQGQTQNARGKSIEQQFMQLQRAEEEAETKKDIAALNRLLSDDFIFTAPNGAIIDKKQFIKGAGTDVSEGETINYDDVHARVYGKTAVVRYMLIVKSPDKAGKDNISRYRNTVVWVKQQGHWRMVAIHVSRIRP
jgi:ketosteroid isomerase-like protein